MTEVADKVIWITGASSGIGEALVHELSGRRNRIVISARGEAGLARVRDSITDDGTQVLVLPLDLADGATIGERVATVIEKFGRVDILINNAGLSQRSLAMETLPEVERRLMEINYFGTVALSKEVIRHMIRQGGGHVVVVSSLVGKFGTPLRSAYSASKHALHGFFDSLRAEVWRDNIRVTIVCPGFIRTKISVHAMTEDGSQQGTMDQSTAQGMTPPECARQIVAAIRKDREEVLIGGREIAGVYVKRYLPGLFSTLIRRVRVT